MATLTIGHVLNAGLTIALAAAAASITEHPSTAAIVTLSVTVGTWIINFIAAVQGGHWERIASYTPTAMVAQFQHGLLRVDMVLVALVLIAGGLGLGAVWMRIGVAMRRRILESLALGLLMAILIVACTRVSESWDLSENRMNSFPEADEGVLRQIRAPLRIEAHLAPEDPRRADLERQGLSKLRRVMPNLQVQYVSATSIGLFEQTSPHYGEIWYELSGRKQMSRITTAEGVLETIYALAGVKPPRGNNESVFRGHPLAVAPRGAAVVFYGLWPAGILIAGMILRRIT
jgi:hypothetical protein